MKVLGILFWLPLSIFSFPMQGTTNSPKNIFFTLRLFMILANIPIAYLINSRFGAKRKLITSYIHDISSSTQWIKIIYYERRPRTIYHSRAIVANVFLLKTHVTAHTIYVCSSSTALLLPCSICYSCIFCSKLQEYCKKYISMLPILLSFKSMQKTLYLGPYKYIPTM